jgi:Ca2+-binding EF-hand superfamily protein
MAKKFSACQRQALIVSAVQSSSLAFILPPIIVGAMMKRVIGILLASVFCCSPVGAQDATGAPSYALIQNMQKYREAYIAQLMQPFRTAAGDDQVLTAEDVARQAQIGEAAQRAATLRGFFAADLDADMVVTKQEWETLAENANRPQVGNTRQNGFAAWDMDKNGSVTVAEVYAYAKSQPFRDLRLGNAGTLSGLMEIAPRKDGRLTAQELEQAGQQAFAYYDKDGDGVLGPEEIKVLQQDKMARGQVALQQAQMANCGLPKPEAGQKMLFVSGYEGAALSDVTVAGQDKETNVVELKIEPGSEPLFVMAVSYKAMIWRLTGDVGRVARFVAAPAGGGVGVAGLAKAKTTFLINASCLQRLPEAETAGKAWLKGLEQTLGKPVDGAYSAYTLSSVALPSQTSLPDSWTYDKTRPRVSFSWGPLQPADNPTAASLQRFNPGGVVSLDPAEIVASDRAERYEVLPQEAGLLQLIQNGSIRYEQTMGYVIERPIPRFPAGLAGAHAVRFVLATGVPRPAGSPGHSTVITYEEAQKLPMGIRPMIAPRRLPGQMAPQP